MSGFQVSKHIRKYQAIKELKNITTYLTKNFLVSTGKTMSTSLVTLLLLPLVIQKLGVEMYGIISITLMFSGISSLIDLGLSKAIILLCGKDKSHENTVVSSALYINLLIITLISLLFVGLQLSSIDLLGSKLNLDSSSKTIVLNIGFLLLLLMLLNNWCRAILEANYKIHVVNLTLTIYTPLLYLSIFLLSFFVQDLFFYVIIPFLLTLFMFIFNLIYIKHKTNIKIIRVTKKDLAFVIKKSLAFLNIGLINSMIMPLMRYLFILLVADVSLYAIFDLSFKIAMLANSFIIALASPMFAVFSSQIQQQTQKMIQVSYKIFFLSLLLYLIINVTYYYIGNYFLTFLGLETHQLNILFNTSSILIVSLGSVAIVEIFYRYFLGNNQLTRAFFLKLVVPIFGVILFFLLPHLSDIYRFIYAYSISLILSALIIGVCFFTENSNPKFIKL